MMPGEIPILSGPCRAPDLRFTDMPWSPLSAAISVTPSSDFLLFFPDPKAYIESLAPPKSQTREDFGNSDKPALPAPLKSIHTCGASCEASPSGESVDPPRGDNPVGPPDEFTISLHNSRNDNLIQAARRLGRRHSLNPEQRSNAALMRRVHNCWHCVFQKYPVCMPLIRLEVSLIIVADSMATVRCEGELREVLQEAQNSNAYVIFAVV